jgi:hypothetical protein
MPNDPLRHDRRDRASGLELFFILRGWLTTIVLAFVIALGAPAIASAAPALPGNVQLGMSIEQLREAVPALVRVPRPQRMAGGLVGSWSAPAIEVAGVQLTPTFYFAGQVLQRIEYAGGAADAPKAFDALRAWARSRWSQELASQGAEGSYASWATEDADVYLQMTNGERAEVRLVIKRRVLKDGGEL